jgi:hypothetical protein
MKALALSNAAILFFLGALHFYWAIGGIWAADVVVPTKPTGEKLFKTSALSCVVVGGGLWLLSIVPVVNAGLVFKGSDFAIFRYGLLTMGIIFLIRFMCDFKWVGLFKKVKGTSFAKNDTLYYAPLCLFLSVSSFVLYFGQ